jgi:hypothetical protein
MDQLAGAIDADSARPPGIYAFEIVDYDRDLSVGFDVLTFLYLNVVVILRPPT